MPRTFPTHESVVQLAKDRGYRAPSHGESHMEYRAFVIHSILTDPVNPDVLEATEVLATVGITEFRSSQERNEALISAYYDLFCSKGGTDNE